MADERERTRPRRTDADTRDDFAAFDAIGEPVMVIDKDYRIVSMNRAARKVYGDTGPGRVHCHSVSHDFEHPCAAEPGHPCPKDMLDAYGLDSASVIHVHRTADGVERHFSVRMFRIPDADLFLEIHTDISGIMYDILLYGLKDEPETPQSNANDVVDYVRGQLQTTVERFTNLIHTLQEGIVVSDESMLTVFANEQFMELFALPGTAESLRGMNCTEMTDLIADRFACPEDFEHSTTACLVKRTRVVGETMLMADGRVMERDYFPMYFGDTFRGHFWYYRDVTERRGLEQQLAKSEELFRTMAVSSPTSVFLFDDTRIIYCNPSMEDLTGYTRTELLAMAPWNVIHPEFRSQMEMAMRQTAGGDMPESICVEGKVLTRGGRERWVRGYTTVAEHRGKTVGLGNFIDITERKLFEHALTQKSRQLEDLNRDLEAKVATEIEKRRRQEQIMVQQSKLAVMGEMLSAIAHQWRQPLNALGLIIQDMQDAFEFGEFDKTYLGETVSEGMRQIDFMSRTIDDFRNFFKPSKEMTTFDIFTALDEVLALTGAQLAHLDIAVTIDAKDLADGGLAITGYKNEFKQVIVNILNNAKDAVVERRETDKTFTGSGRIGIGIALHVNAVRISISDNGGGIPQSAMDRIFEPYFTTKEEGQGTGIGLYMSKVIIETSMNGTLTAENIADGALLIVTVPLRPDVEIP